MCPDCDNFCAEAYYREFEAPTSVQVFEAMGRWSKAQARGLAREREVDRWRDARDPRY